MASQDDFYITLISDENNDFSNSNNNIADFTNKLPTPLILNGKYKVALTEIYVPPFYLKSDNNDEVRQKRDVKSNELLIYLDVEDYEIKITNPLLDRLKNHTFDIPAMFSFLLTHINFYFDDRLFMLDKLYENLVEKFIRDMNDIELNDPDIRMTAIEDETEQIYLNLPVGIENENTPNEKFITRKVVIRPTQYSNFKSFLRQLYQQIPLEDRDITVFVKSILKLKGDIELDRIKLFREKLKTAINNRAAGKPNKIAYVFPNKPLRNRNSGPYLIENGQTPSDQQNVPASQINQTQTGNVNNDELLNVIPSIDIEAVTEPDIDPQLGYPLPKKRKYAETLNNCHMLFIYTDVIDFSIYASHLFKILRIIPFFPVKVKEGVHHTFTNPEYYTVTKSFIDSISIKINNRGEKLNFLNPTIPIYVKLHFKSV